MIFTPNFSIKENENYQEESKFTKFCVLMNVPFLLINKSLNAQKAFSSNNFKQKCSNPIFKVFRMKTIFRSKLPSRKSPSNHCNMTLMSFEIMTSNEVLHTNSTRNVLYPAGQRRLYSFSSHCFKFGLVFR